MADSHTDAIEQLRSQIENATAAANADPLWGLDSESITALVERHEVGTNYSGWKNPYPNYDPRCALLEYQHRYFQDTSRFKFALQARQTGKDFTSEGEAVRDCLKRPGIDWLIGAPSERQALDSLEQAKLWAEAWKVYTKGIHIEREGSTSQHLLKSAEIVFTNKSRIRAVPGKPDTVRGRSANVLLTEFDYFDDPTATWRAIFPSLTNSIRGGEKKCRLVTTPNGHGSAAYKIWTRPDSSHMAWSRHFVTIHHAVLMGLRVDIAQIREAMGDAEGFAQEYLCQWLDASSVLLPYELIALAESADATETLSAALSGSGDPVFIGIDFGRSSDPTVCWTLQLVGGVLWTREVLVLENTATPQQEEILRSRLAVAQRVCFDATGPGIGLADYLVERHGEWKPSAHQFGKIERCTFSTALKREIFPRLRRRFEAPTTLRIPIGTAIREDLHQVQQVVTNGEFNYWSPRTRQGHSDRATALALAVRAASESAPSGVFTADSLASVRLGPPRATPFSRPTLSPG